MKPLSLSIHSSLPRARRAVGFTLIEIAVVVLIGSMLLVAGLSMFKARLDAVQVEVTQKRQDAIKQALIAYLARNKRLPCPDNDNNGTENRLGTSPFACSTYFGNVPYVDLGLERSAALDGWENHIRYIVSPNWRFTYSSTVTDSRSTTLVPNSTYNPDAAFVPKMSMGVIALHVDKTIVPVLDPCNAAAPSNNGPVVALVSHGKNGFLANNIRGNINAGTAGAEEIQNADPSPVTTAPTCTWNVFRIVKRDATDIFDDVVMTINESEFTAPLIASGSVLGSPDAALAKANDIILGKIAGNRAACPGTSNPPCAAGNYYYALPVAFNTFPDVFPSEVLTYGVTYAVGSGVSSIDSANPTPSTNTAYTLSTSGGTLSRTMTVGELRSILLRVAGFI